MRRILLLVASVLLLPACHRNADDPIEPVPAQSAESANRLMSEAENAAENAAGRMEAAPAANTTTTNATDTNLLTENQQ